MPSLELAALVQGLDAVIFDCDGVLWTGLRQAHTCRDIDAHTQT
jgi:ribonucleotide monophosphatase NagD (HAD superfamily)